MKYSQWGADGPYMKSTRSGKKLWGTSNTHLEISVNQKSITLPAVISIFLLTSWSVLTGLFIAGLVIFIIFPLIIFIGLPLLVLYMVIRIIMLLV